MLGLIAVLAVMHIAQLVIYFQVGDPDKFDFIQMVDFDYETNFPSLYSSLAIFFCSSLLWFVRYYHKQSDLKYHFHWLGLAVIFTFLGFDEALGLHEELGDLVEEQHWFKAEGLLYFAWVVPYSILFLIFSLSYLKFVFSLPRQIMLRFISAGVLFITGAVGFEIVSAKEADLNGSETIYYSVLYTIEELCEMVAMVIFSNGLLHYIRSEIGSVNVTVSD